MTDVIAEVREPLRTAHPSSASSQASATGLDKYQLLLAAHPVWRNIALVLSFVLLPAALAVVWYVWVQLLPTFWNWAFAELSFKNIAGFFGVLFLTGSTIWLLVFPFLAVAYVVDIFANDAAKKVQLVLAHGSTLQANAEDELAKQDKTGLVPLLRYSRVQLESYYAIGLNQTQRSFRYSIIAMWIGFAVILSGIVIRVVDLDRFGLRPLDTDLSTLIIVSGAIIEVISALFLWVYRSSVRQLTYFYNRQMYNHSVLMSQRIAETMTSADDIKKTIIEKLLDRSWAFEPDALPSAQSLASFRSSTS